MAALLVRLSRRAQARRVVVRSAIVALAGIAGCLVAVDALAGPVHRVAGTVRDASGAAVAGARVAVETAAGSETAVVTSTEDGQYAIAAVPAGRYVVRVRAPGFTEYVAPLEVRGDGASLTVLLEVAGVSERVTVTAALNSPRETAGAAQPVNVIDADTIHERDVTVVAQAAAEEPGLAVQRTSPSVSGVFVRGLTGNKVNVFVDGVRYSTSAQRGGISTFLNLIEPTALDTFEVLRGPGSAQYGSDALGGSLQFLTVAPALAGSAGRRLGGSAGLSLGSSDELAGGNLLLSYSASRVGVLANVAGRSVGEFRAGQGIDSHAAVTRFLGLRSDALMDERLPDTGFTQYAEQVRGRWAISPNAQINASYSRSRQDGAKRYDQLLGGDGNLVAALNGLTLDFFYTRYEQLGVAGFDSVSATFSVNQQREERVNQGGNGNPRASIASEPERLLARGVQVQATRTLTRATTLTLGGEGYFEGITSPSTGLNPVTGVRSPRRGRVPSGATYANGGAFAQLTASPAQWLQLVGNLRYGGVQYEADAADSVTINGAVLWPDDLVRASAWTYRGSAAAKLSDRWTLSGSVSSGFRAPHMTDLGTLGLTGSGFEVAAPDVAGRDARVGSTANAQAISTGLAVEQVRPETSVNVDSGLHYRSPRLRADVTFFVNLIDGNLEKYSLLLPQGAVGTTLGSEVITSQLPNGVVYVAASTSPVLVRTNLSDAMVRGVEQSVEWRATRTLTVSTVGTWLHAEDRAMGTAPNIEGGTPAPEIYLFARYSSPTSRWWVEPWGRAVARNTRLSTLDVEDRRSGATRTRSSIQNFFRNGATARGWVTAGTDGTLGNADDLLLETGETLAQVHDRVLGAGVNSSPLFSELPGFVVFGVRGGVKLGRHGVVVGVENLTDTNYRGISWGLDGAGRSVYARYLVRF